MGWRRNDGHRVGLAEHERIREGERATVPRKNRVGLSGYSQDEPASEVRDGRTALLGPADTTATTLPRT